MRRFARKSWKAVALAIAIVLIPTVAFAAVGAFTSTNATPAVKGTNSSTLATAAGVQGLESGVTANLHYGVFGSAAGTGGVGVNGTGTKYGVFSSGALGVANGKLLVCMVCVTTADLASGSVTAAKLANGSVTGSALAAGSVGQSALGSNSIDNSKIIPGAVNSASISDGTVGPADLSSAAKQNVLASGETESGVYGAYSDSETTVVATITYRRPLAAPITNVVDTLAGPDANCPGAGQAAAGYLCFYPTPITPQHAFTGFTVVNTEDGAVQAWGNTTVGGVLAVWGTWTVTAP